MLKRQRIVRRVTHKEFSAKGGKAGKGAVKARTHEQASAAAKARWNKPRSRSRKGGQQYWLKKPKAVETGALADVKF